MKSEEKTTDVKKISLTVEKFIIVVFSIASISATVSGIISTISSLEDKHVAEQEARRKNDNRLQEEIEEIREDIKFILDQKNEAK